MRNPRMRLLYPRRIASQLLFTFFITGYNNWVGITVAFAFGTILFFEGPGDLCVTVVREGFIGYG